MAPASRTVDPGGDRGARRTLSTLELAGVGIAILSGMFGVAVVGAIVVIYGSDAWSPLWSTVGLGINALSVLVAWATLRDLRRPIDAWRAGDRSDPTATRDAALQFSATLAIRAGWTAWFVHLPVTLPLTARATSTAPLSVVGLGVGLAIAVVAAVLVLTMTLHELLAPMIDDASLATSETATPPPAGRALSLGWRMRGSLLFALLAGAAGGGAAVRIADSADAFLVAAFSGGLVIGVIPFALFEPGLIRPTVRPLNDLTAAIVRTRLGDLTARVPVTSVDEFGVLAVAFNDMQQGLRERAALHDAFGSYVDPLLTERLVASGSAMFTGEELNASVAFVDVRDFTAYSERVGAAAAVARLNELFEVVVPVLRDHGGHANRYLGDGVLAVFGAPSRLERHADAAVAAAIEVQRLVREAFGDEVRLGIGINAGEVIAGTVGGGGRYEFTVIGDAVNVASRVEQLTKETGDAILITEAVRRLLSAPPPSIDRGAFDLKGKAAKVVVHAVQLSDR